MKNKPTLVILAAGLGSRYGTLKQIDRIGPSGERIIDYSVYDAINAGFGKIVYVIRKSFEEEFKEVILDVLPKEIEAEVVYQELDEIPGKPSYSKERKKPWGTGQALLVASSVVKEPFAVINADDFYGAESFQIAADFLKNSTNKNELGLVGYKLKNTLSEYGSVSRGVCEVNEDRKLLSIIERTEIKISDSQVIYKDETDKWQILSGEEIISMNMFLFKPFVFNYVEEYFKKFIEDNENNLIVEFYMPTIVDNLIKSDSANVKVLETNSNWFGLTYSEDKPVAIKRIAELIEEKKYPVKLWT